MTEILFEPYILQVLWKWAMEEKVNLILFVLGGFVIQVIIMIYFLLPWSTSYNYRYWIASTFGVPVITLILIAIFGSIDSSYNAVGSDEYLTMSIPFIISLCLFIYGFIRLYKDEKSKNRRMINYSISIVGIFGWIWSFYISEAFMYNCILASCV